ncbi:hypothetical protein MUN82_06570 [Hymenobacter aerilatus]|uniref:Uncharacterized protein n=1 Tax=Hymenobacter aerilatus TaxID=2932251 RepID=A0A8T9T4B4_9BACT|nr:hypothetical protein [Hymenobacter aerilatus]UOR06759.1 hypothetical protein MUN82_06570 [Hymenobacter aerilatus]
MNTSALLPRLLQAAKTTGLTAWQTGRLFRRAITTALTAVHDVLQTEIQKGNMQLVSDFLANKALPAARALLLERMAARILVRLGLRGTLASNVVGWVLPLVLEQLVQVGRKTGFFHTVQTNTTVLEALNRLENLKQAVWKRLVPDAGSGAEVLPDDTPEPLLLPPHASPASQA